MDMTTATVPAWFADLPLSDPRCKNDSCEAFKTAHNASQTEISWASQFLYGKYATWFYTGIIGVFFLSHMFHVFIDRKPHHEIPSFVNKAKAVVRSVSYRRISGPMGIYLGLPSFGVMFIVLVSFITSVVMAFTQRPYYRGSRLYGSPPLGVRSGLMAAALIPLTIALAGKVNLITMLTGIGHEKLNALHRWVAWILFFLSTVHTIPFFVQDSREGLLQQKFYAMGSLEFNGVPAYSFCFFLVAFSFPIIRRKFYETFVFSHIIGAITFFGLCFWHFTNELDSWYYLYGGLAVWLIQLLGRAFWKSSAFKISEDWFNGLPTVAHRLPDGMAKLEVFVPDTWSWKPGQHVFLRFPHLNPLDNHPFTIASIPRSSIGGEKDTGNVMVFFVRAHSGSTKQLLSWLEKTPDAKLTTIIDGPYGTVVRGYENCAEDVTLVAGGNGISACLPYVQHLGAVMKNESCVTKRVKLIWMVQKHKNVEWVVEELQQAIRDAPSGAITVDIYVTDESSKDRASISGHHELETKETKVTTASSSSSVGDIHSFDVHYSGRPNLLQLIPQLIGARRTAVIGCGPESLKIDLSNSVARLQGRILKGEAIEISLHTETFDW